MQLLMKQYEIVDHFWIDEDQRVKAIKTTQSDCWYLRYNLPGVGQKKMSLKTKSKKEARLRGSKFAVRLAAGDVAGTRESPVLIEDAASEMCKRLRDRGRKEVSVAIYDRVYRQIVAWMKARGHVYLKDLTLTQLETFERQLRERGVPVPPKHKPPVDGKLDGRHAAHKVRPLMPKTLRDTMKVIRSLIRFSLKRGKLAKDPAQDYELPPGSSDEIEIFALTELQLIFADPDTLAAPIWKFLLMTCLRISELCWLLKSDVILDGNGRPKAIMIRRKVCPFTGEEWLPKHKLERLVPLTAEASDIVAEAMAASTTPWAFEAPDTFGARKGQWKQQRLLKKLRSRLQAAGIDHGTLHVFRHTGATRYANDVRMPLAQLQKFLGHRDIKTTMRYLHPQADDIAESIARVSFTGLSLTVTVPSTIASTDTTSTPPALPEPVDGTDRSEK